MKFWTHAESLLFFDRPFAVEQILHFIFDFTSRVTNEIPIRGYFTKPTTLIPILILCFQSRMICQKANILINPHPSPRIIREHLEKCQKISFIIHNFSKEPVCSLSSLILYASVLAQKVLGPGWLDTWIGNLILCAQCMKLGSAFAGCRLVQMSYRLARPDEALVNVSGYNLGPMQTRDFCSRRTNICEKMKEKCGPIPIRNFYDMLFK